MQKRAELSRGERRRVERRSAEKREADCRHDDRTRWNLGQVRRGEQIGEERKERAAPCTDGNI